MGDTAYCVLELGLHANAQQVTDASPLADLMRCDIRPLQNAPGIRLAVPVSEASACLPWNRFYRIRKLSGRSSPWTGMAKESEP